MLLNGQLHLHYIGSDSYFLYFTSDMAPKLYMTPTSPPVRAVLMAAGVLNVDLEHELVNLWEGEHLTADYLKLNPQHTVPTLVEEDNFVLWDSHAILGYLVGRYGENDDLYPKDDVKHRAVIDQRLHFDSSILFARGVLIILPVIQGAKDIPDERVTHLKEAYGFLEKMLEGNEYVAGDDLTIADFSIVTTITSWDVLVPVEEDKFPNIRGWIKRMQAFPYYEENQNGLDEFRNMVIEKLSS